MQETPGDPEGSDPTSESTPDGGTPGDADTSAAAGPEPDGGRETAASPAPEPAAPGDTTPDAERRRRLPRLRDEVLLAVELAGLTALAFTRPVLDSFGRSPQSFLARNADALDVVAFALVIALAPVIAVALVGTATRLFGSRMRAVTHLVLLGGLTALTVLRFGSDATSWSLPVVAVLAVVAAVAVALARHRLPSARSYLRVLGATAVVIFVVQFLVLSPSASLVTSRPVAAGGEGELASSTSLPPIVVITVDAFPTAQLLDGHGQIDAGLYPEIAALAGGATWYRNNSTVSAFTYEAVPAMLTGQLPRSGLPNAATYPDNLFTLFAGTHRVHAVEQITRLCPTDVCRTDGGTALPALLSDAVDWWRGGVEREVASGARILPGVLEDDRGEQFVDWIDQQHFSTRAGQPGLWYYHLLLPHDPWVLLADGTPYAPLDDQPYGNYLGSWLDTGAEVGRQRQLLQARALDGMIGHLVDQLTEAGVYDDALVVVAGDHGEAFEPREPLRGFTTETETEVGWTPLIIKAPGQTAGRVDDTNVWSIDLMPTIAGTLGLVMPWDTDGVDATDPAERRHDSVKEVATNDFSDLPTVDGRDVMALDGPGGLADLLTADALDAGDTDVDEAVWRRTAHGALVGCTVDEFDVAADADAAADAAASGELAVEQLGNLERSGDPPLLEFLATTGLDPGATVAVAVNGQIAAVAPVTTQGADTVVHALLRPDSFRSENEVAAFLVTGAPGSETLQPLSLTSAA